MKAEVVWASYQDGSLGRYSKHVYMADPEYTAGIILSQSGLGMLLEPPGGAGDVARERDSKRLLCVALDVKRCPGSSAGIFYLYKSNQVLHQQSSVLKYHCTLVQFSFRVHFRCWVTTLYL